MRKILAMAILLVATAPAFAADNAVTATPGSGITMRTKDVGALVQQPFVGLGNDSGTSIIGAGTTVPVSGSVTVSGTPTVNQGTPPWTVNPGTASSWGVQGQGSTTSGQSGILNQAAVVSGAPTYVATQTSPLTLDTAGNLRVNVVAGGASGGTSSNFGSAFPTPGTAIGLTNGTNMVPWSATTNYGTAPAAIAVPAVNAFVTNAATAGRTTTGLNAQGASPVVQPSAPNTATGGTPFPIVNVTASANATLIKNTATVLFGCQVGNNSTSIAYLHIFNKATAPTPGTDSAIKTLIIPGPSAGGGGSNANFGPGGIALPLGLGITITAGIGTVDNTTIATANQIVVNCDFE
jgi:hypothetical protein